MPFDSIIFKGYQGDEEDLEKRIVAFLNVPPAKRIVTCQTWTVGITIYVMIIFGRSAIQAEKTLPHGASFGTYTGNTVDY